MEKTKNQICLFIGIGSGSRVVGSKQMGIEGQKYTGRPTVDMRGVQDPTVRITRINEGTGRSGIKGVVILRNGRNLSRKVSPEGKASYLKT